MFAELVGWYTGSERNRRRYPRVKRDFDVEYTLDGSRWDVAQGVDLSGGGMCMISFRTIMQDAFDPKDWEAVIRSITGRNSSSAERFEPIQLTDADVNRLLPADFRENLIRELKSRSRIDPQKPQLAFEYGGLVYEKDRCMHQFTVRSSINHYTGLKKFVTRVLVNDENNEVVFLS